MCGRYLARLISKIKEKENSNETVSYTHLNTKLYLEEHPDFASDIEAQVRAHASELFAGRAGKRRGGSLDNAPARAAAEKPAAPAPAPQVQEAPKTRAKKPSIDIMMEDE